MPYYSEDLLMDNRMKAPFAVVLALAFIVAVVALDEESDYDATDISFDETIDQSKTYTSGQTFELDKDYEIKTNVVLTFEAGATLHFEAMSPWSIKGAAGSTFVFKEGAAVRFTVMGYDDKEITFSEETSIEINGTIAYAFSSADSKITATLTFTNGTIVAVDQAYKMKFKETTISVSPEIGSKGLSDIKGDIKIKSDGITFALGDIEIGSINKIDASLNGSFTASGETVKDYVVTLKGNVAINATFYGITVDANEKVDITAGITGIPDTIDWEDLNKLKDAIPYITGTASGEIKISCDTDTLKIDGAVIKNSAEFDSKGAKIGFSLDVNKITLNYGDVSGSINDIRISDELTVEAGSFMKLLSARNILGTYEFIETYGEEVARESMEEFLIDFLGPMMPDGAKVKEIVDEIISKIPEDEMYSQGMIFAYSLFFIEGVDGLEFDDVCLNAYNSTTSEGIVSKKIEYIGLVANEILKSITGLDDYQSMSVSGYGSVSIGKVTAEAEKGYKAALDGLSLKVTFGNEVKMEASVGIIQVTADSEKVKAEIVTPKISAECTWSENKIKAEFKMEGDLKCSYQDKSEGTTIPSMSFAFKGIKVTDTIELEAKVATIISSDYIGSIEIIIDKIAITTGSMSEKSTVTLNGGNILDLFSLRNLDNIVDFVLNVYDEDENVDAYASFLKDVITPAYPGDPSTVIDAIVENTPEELIPVIGFQCQFVYYNFDKAKLNLGDVCANIAAGIKDLQSPEGIMEYTTKVGEKIFEVVTGIEDFQAPTLSVEHSVDIGSITIAYGTDELVFNGADFDLKIKDDTISLTGKFKGLDFDYATEEFEARFVLPTINAKITYDDEFYAELSVKGELTLMYYDPQDHYNSFTFSIQDISTSEIIKSKDGIVTLDSKYSIGTSLVSFDVRENFRYVAFMLDGADLTVKGTIDISTLIDAIVTEDYSKVTADLEIKGSADGVMYKQMMGERTRTEDLKAAADELSLDIKVSNGEKGFACSGKIGLDDAYFGNAVSLESVGKATLNVSYADNKGTFDFAGDFEKVDFVNEEASRILTATNIAVKGDITPGETAIPSLAPTSLSADVKIWELGIVCDFGKVTMTGDRAGDYQFAASKCAISGNYTGDGDLKSVSGNISGVTFIPANDSDFMIKYTDAKIEYVMKDGSKLTTTLVPRDSTKAVEIECATSGEGVIVDPSAYLGNTMIFDILESDYYAEYRDSYTVTGNAPIVVFDIDPEFADIHGKVYIAKGTAVVNGQTVIVEFEGALLCCDFGLGGTSYSIVPLPGYNLDPSSYEGFTVDADNKVTLEPGATECHAKSTGKEYTVTINGAPVKVRYGEDVSYPWTGEKVPIWFVDSKGNVCGYVEDGVLHWEYCVLGDTTLTPVYGTKVETGEPGAVQKVNDDAFYVLPGEERFVVENKSGVRIIIDNDPEIGLAKFSAVATKYDGMKAYDIKASTDAYVLVPISSHDAFVYHVVNGVEVPVVTEIWYEPSTGQHYASFLVGIHDDTVYAVEEVDHHGGGSGSDNTLLYVSIVVVILIIVAIVAVAAKKKQGQNA